MIKGPKPPAAGPQGRPQDAHRINHQIRAPQIRVIGEDGEQLGIMTPEEAREIAGEQGLDLVEVSPRAVPPVCRIMDYGKFRYKESKKASAHKSARVEIKTLTLRPKTDEHDLETKINQARAFLKKGDRVKFVMRLRGREHAHKDLWYAKMNQIIEALKDISVCTQSPKDEMKTISAMVEPTAAASTTPGSAPAPRPQGPTGPTGA